MRNGISTWLKDLICGLARCAVPLVMLGLWIVLLGNPQGQDVLRRAVERAVLDQSVSDLVALGLSSLILGLAVWYSMRWLLIVDFPGLPLSSASGRAGRWQKSMPRVFGALVPAVVGGLCLWMHAQQSDRTSTMARETLSTDAEHIKTALLWVAGIFGLLALALLVFLIKRRKWFKLKEPKHGPGSAQGPAPADAPPLLGARDPLPPTTLRVIVWALLLTGLAALVISVFPLSVGRVIGSAALGALALAGMTLFLSFVFTFWPLRRGLPNLVPLLLLAVALLGYFNEKPPSSLVTAPDPWPPVHSVAQAYEDWRERAPGDTFYVVATEGGGIRAAYWTAAVLEALEKHRDIDFPRSLFAISSVSGGSIGAGAWLAGWRARHCSGDTVNVPHNVATRALSTDFLSPTLGLMFYPDALSNFWVRPLPAAGRSRGLEEGVQRTMSRLPDKPLQMRLDQFYRLDAGPGQDGHCDMPYALFNATVAESGQRALLSVLDTRHFADVYAPADGVEPSWRHQSVAALMHHSARFPLVSPPGPVVDRNHGDAPLVRLLDGGYFDNSGIVTALEVIDEMKAVEEKKKQEALARGETSYKKKKVMLVVIANGAYDECIQDQAPPYLRCSVLKRKTRTVGPGLRFLYEVAPLATGVYFARDSHVRDALRRAMLSLPKQMAVISGSVEAPLGWSLSRSMVNRLDQAAERVEKMTLSEFPPQTGQVAAASQDVKQ